MLRILAILLVVAPLGAEADTPARGRSAEAIRLAVERQVQRSGVSVRQSGRGHEAVLSQSGTENQGIIVQRGSGHFASLEQAGTGNAATIIQLGRGASVVVAQTGGESGASIQAGR